MFWGEQPPFTPIACGGRHLLGFLAIPVPDAVSLSSARTTNRFPSPRCASVIQTVRACASGAEMQPQLQPALLRFVSDWFLSKGMIAHQIGDARKLISRNLDVFCILILTRRAVTFHRVAAFCLLHAHQSLKSPLCSCVLITLPTSS